MTGVQTCALPISNDVLGDDRLPIKQWMKDNGLQSFAGYPLMFRGDLLGVIAMFGRRPLSGEEFERLATFAYQAAIAIENGNPYGNAMRLGVMYIGWNDRIWRGYVSWLQRQ